MPIRGGKLHRLISASIHEVIRQGLDDLGWLDPSRNLTLLAKPLPLTEEIRPNKIAHYGDLESVREAELGSNRGEFSWSQFVEIFAENESVLTELSFDVQHILEGRIPSIGRTGPEVTVYDWSLATPVPILTVEVENMVSNRPDEFIRPWQHQLRSLRFDAQWQWTGEDV